MKKLVVLGLCLACGTGCGRGWLPRLFHGAPCLGGACLSAPPACANCPGSAISAGYGGEEYIGDSSPMSGQIIGDHVIGEPSYGSGGATGGWSNGELLTQPPTGVLPSPSTAPSTGRGT